MVEKYIQLLEVPEEKTDTSWIDFRGLAWILSDDYNLDEEI